MANILTKLLHFFGDGIEREQSAALKTQIIEGKDADIKELKKINRSVRLLLAEGSIEIIVKNVQGVFEEDYRKKKKIKKTI
jgi:hypothetical protein